MTPQLREANIYSDSDYPTSPWTEAYHAAPMQQQSQTEDTAKQAFDSEAVRPTHDALSAIYNWGY